MISVLLIIIEESLSDNDDLLYVLSIEYAVLTLSLSLVLDSPVFEPVSAEFVSVLTVLSPVTVFIFVTLASPV